MGDLWEAKLKKKKIFPPPISSTYKINTNSTDVAFGERIIRESKEKTRFAHTRVTNQDKFEQEVTGKEKKRKKRGTGIGRKKEKRNNPCEQAERERERERERREGETNDVARDDGRFLVKQSNLLVSLSRHNR